MLTTLALISLTKDSCVHTIRFKLTFHYSLHSHAAFLDTDPSGGGNIYNPFYNSPYNTQTGLLQNTNQIYPNQIPSIGGQYYVPGLTNQNQGGVNLLPANQNLNSQWPQNSLSSSVYQNSNSFPYQQQNFIPANSGYVPVAQNPVQVPAQQPINPVNTNVQPVQQSVNPGGVATGQQPVPAQPKQVPVAQPNSQNSPVQNSPAPVPGSAVETSPEQKDAGKDADSPSNKGYDTHTADVDSDVKQQHTDDSQRQDISNNRPVVSNPDSVKVEKPNADSSYGRHSEESSEDFDYQDRDGGRTYPPATKAHTQVDAPTQSTVAGEKTVHSSSHSEGFPDYSWMNINYNDPVQRVSGKKGVGLKPTDGKPVNSDKVKAATTKNPTHGDQPETKQGTRKGSKSPTFSSYGQDRLQTDDFDTDDYRFDDFRRPSSNRRPYDRYDSRYDSPRQRPGSGSRFPPYYDIGYGRGKNRNPYPVWDPYKDEYYYPDSYDDRPYGDYGKGNTGNYRCCKTWMLCVAIMQKKLLF